MTFYLSIRKEAESDIAEAYQYYEGCRENLAQIVHSGKIETDLHTSWKISNCIITHMSRFQVNSH